ncbi:MAG TPA: VOC family protein [Candidatus Binatia bacterium]|jgi:PhnB protein
MVVRAIPEGYHSVTPYLIGPDVAGLVAFFTAAFGATETERVADRDGTVRHAEVRIGDSRVMMGEPSGDYAPMPVMLQLYVEDVDAVYARAMGAGATSIEEPADQFYGDRRGGVRDPNGNQWWIATRKEDLSHEEIVRRAAAATR